jgi:spermidine synthase
MMVLAACGFIYEYMFSHFAGRVLGSNESVIYGIIGVMVVSMGIGALLAKNFKDPFHSLSIIESLIAFIAVSGIFVISGLNAFVLNFPRIIAEAYNIPVELSVESGFYNTIVFLSNSSSYVVAALAGILIGMEIPLVARIRETVHKQHLEHNTGMIYGADYIGAGIGAFLWVVFLLKIDIDKSMFIISSTNVFIGLLFILFFKKHIKKFKTLLTIQMATAVFIVVGCSNMGNWEEILENSLLTDTKTFSMNTTRQRIAISEGTNPNTGEIFSNFFINGRLQFSMLDEFVYHGMLVEPVMNSTKKNDNVLIIGGGDGLALRDVLKHDPKSVTLIDLDPEIINLFTNAYFEDGIQVNKAFLKLNEYSFSDPRLNLILGDAYLKVRDLFFKKVKFDNIIIDLPDPSHPDLNKLYSRGFYKILNRLLNDDGAIVVQSTSPYYAKNAFIAVKKTMEAAGFIGVEQYHANVPTFGEWGWTIAKKDNSSPLSILKSIDRLKVENEWLNKGTLIGSFYFGNKYYDDYENIIVNTVGSSSIYNYYSFYNETVGTNVLVN